MNMQHYKNIVVGLLLSVSFSIKLYTNALTFYVGKNVRLGDHLITYCKAKFFSYKTNLPLYCPYFKYKEQLMLDTIEKSYSEEIKIMFKHQVLIHNFTDYFEHKQPNTLYMTEAFFNNGFWFPTSGDTPHTQPHHFHDMINDFKSHPSFMQKLKQCIQPKIPLRLIVPPEGYTSIGVHVRKNGLYDKPLYAKQYYTLFDINKAKNITPSGPFSDITVPARFPPEQYYIAQLLYLLNKLKKQKCYIHIFTNDPHPDAIAERFAAFLPQENISIGYRTTTNNDNLHVLEDLFSMAQCDYLIRPHSCLSSIAEIIGEHTLVISPRSWQWFDTILWISDVYYTQKRKK